MATTRREQPYVKCEDCGTKTPGLLVKRCPVCRSDQLLQRHANKTLE